MKRIFSAIVVLLVVACFASVPAARQAADKPPAFQWLMLTVVGVQPGMSGEWRKIEQEEALPALKKGGSLGREVWTTGVFGVGSEFVIVTPVQSFAQFDGQSPMAKALGPEAASALAGRRARLETGRRTYALRPRPDLSYIPEPGRAPKLAIVSIVEIAAGRNADFENLLKTDAVPAMKKAQAKGYYVSQVVYGGNTQEYITLVAYDTFEEIGKGHPFEIALGQAGVAKLMQKTVGLVTRVDRYISRFVPELSFMAGKPTSDD